MNATLLVRMIFLRLVRFRLQSFFMSLGLIISVVAIILVQTIAAGMRGKFIDFIHDTYPSNTVYLAGGSGFMGGGEGSDRLTMADVRAVVDSVSGITQADPSVMAGMRNVTSVRGTSAYVAVMGSSENGAAAHHRPVEEGVYFSAQDVQQARRVALIGAHTAKALFGADAPLGQTVFVENVALEIVGVLASVGMDPHGGDMDNQLLLPYTLLQDKILQRRYVSGVTFIIDDARVADMDGVAADIVRVMRARHDLSAHAKNDFSVIHSGIMLKMVARAYRTFQIFIPLITAVTFVISAVVILAIMIAVVRERRREIGLRKALGATPASLRRLILLEILTLSVGCAAGGIALAQLALHYLAPSFAAKFGIAHLAPSLAAILTAIGLAMLAGLLGALWPASRAARMDPVAALA